MAAATACLALWYPCHLRTRAFSLLGHRSDSVKPAALTDSAGAPAERRGKIQIAAVPVTGGELVKKTIRLERERRSFLHLTPCRKQSASLTVALTADPALRLRPTRLVDSIAPGPVMPVRQCHLSPATAAAPSAVAGDASAGAPGSRLNFDIVLPPHIDRQSQNQRYRNCL